MWLLVNQKLICWQENKKSDNTSTSQINTSQHILSASQTTCRSRHGSHFSFCLKSLPNLICQSKPGLLRGTLQCQPSDVPQISQSASTTSFLFSWDFIRASICSVCVHLVSSPHCARSSLILLWVPPQSHTGSENGVQWNRDLFKTDVALGC